VGEERLELIRVASDALKTDEIDLVVLNNAPLTLQFQILCGRELLFCRAEKERRLFEVKVLREYWDNQP
jgi:hypothetical protein